LTWVVSPGGVADTWLKRCDELYPQNKSKWRGFDETMKCVGEVSANPFGFPLQVQADWL
jgi:hypothetical protein